PSLSSDVGCALSCWALAALAEAGGVRKATAKAAAGRQAGGGGGQGRQEAAGGRLPVEALARDCLQVTAAALLYGTLQLAAAVHRDNSNPTSSSASATAAAGAAAAAAAPLAAAVLTAASPLSCQAAVAIPAAVGRVLCPWHVAALQQQLHITRLMLLAGCLLPPSYYVTTTTHGDGGDNGCQAAATAATTATAAAKAKASELPQGAEKGSPSSKQPEEEEEEEEEEKQQQQRQRLQSRLLEGCLSVLSTAPPGAEGLCLQALRLALRGELLRAPLHAAHAAAAELPRRNPRLALAAAGMPYNSAASADAPFPLPSTPPDAEAVAEVLFESYAASWLSLISQRRLAAGTKDASSSNTDTAAAAATAPYTAGSDAPAAQPPQPPQPPQPQLLLPRPDPLELVAVSLQGQRGSRLPAPSQWQLMEAHLLPASASASSTSSVRQQQQQGVAGTQQQQQQQVQQAQPYHPVGCALMLCLGLETSSGGSRAGRGAGGAGGGAGGAGGAGGGGGVLRWLTAGPKLQAALQAAYLFRAGEMLPQPPDESSEGSWREPLVRWGLAGLCHRYLCSEDGA
ncbi:hypothetical protein Agub_g1922, partial [Astrephomene gubernaculifera]